MKREVKKVLAWDEEDAKFIVFFISKTEGAYEPYLCVDSTCEERYLNGDVFDTNTWRYMEEIKEPKYRPYKLNKEEAKLFMNQVLVYKAKPTQFETIVDIDTQDELDEYFFNCETLDGKPFGVLVE